MNSNFIKIIVAILLFLCLIDFPYGYYQFVRFAAMFGFAYLTYSATGKTIRNEMFIKNKFQLFYSGPVFRKLWAESYGI